ncbi:FlgD immunoglobulin-like domain containing protein [Paenibacillus sp. strain BS8-2]
MKGIGKGFAVFTILLGGLLLSKTAVHAQDVSIQDHAFTYFNGAHTVADGTASDLFSAHMANDNTGWNIQYMQWDFSALKPGVLYDVYAKVKVEHAVANPSGQAYKLGVYDITDGSAVLPEKTIAASATQDNVWKEVKLGTFKPNASVNWLSFYVGGTANTSQVSDIYVDAFVFREYQDYTIEDQFFYLFNDAASVTEPMAVNNTAVRMANGTGGGWNIQAKIDGSMIEAGKSYTVSMQVKPERTDWNTSAGEMFGYLVYDLTTSTYLVNPTTVTSTSSDKVVYYPQWKTPPIMIDPSHDVRVCFFPVNNAASFPSFKVDRVTLSQVPVDESAVKPIHAYPYKLSPGNGDGLNDSTEITYTLPSAQNVTVTVYSHGSQSTVRTLASNVTQSGTHKIVWDGKNGSGQTVANGLYTMKVSSGATELLRTNVEVIAGVALTPPQSAVQDEMPLGIFYEAGEIPYNLTDAATYLGTTFSDINGMGADTVFLANWHAKPIGVYEETLQQAEANNLRIVGLPDSYLLFNETLYNDEIAMYAQAQSIIDPVRDSSALYGYYLYDEPANDYRLADNLKDMKRLLETADPTRPVLMTYVGLDRVPLHYGVERPQVLSIDPYGVGEGSAIGDFRNIYKYPGFSFEQYMDFSSLQIRKHIDDPAPMWTILQTNNTTGWLRNPTAAEIRAMTYEAIGYGSKGFTYFVYQTEVDWVGIVDEYYNHTDDYETVQTLFSELAVLKPTIKNMRKIGAVATASGGGNSAYATADITTHEDIVTGDNYLVIVNHDCINPANVTVTIDRAKLGKNIVSMTNILNNANITFTTTPTSYIISNLNLAAGDGKLLKLTKSSTAIIYTGQDSDFHVNNGATKLVTDLSTSNGKTAKHTVTNSRTWNIQWFWDKTQLVPGATYDLYAVVKVKYAKDTYVDGYGAEHPFQPSGTAFSFGVYDLTTGTYPVAETTVAASGLENMFWHTVKIGSFTPSQTNSQVVYIMPWDNPNNVSEVYVDQFYFVKQ